MSETKIIMAKKIARKWLRKNGTLEFRIKVYNPIRRDYPNLLRSFRDRKIKLAGADPIPDLGVSESSEGFEIWSSDVKSLKTLKEYFEKRGMETNWIW